MEQIFFTRGKGRVRKLLVVYSDGQQYKLHYTILDRTNPTKEERAQGIKEKRFATLDEIYFIGCDELLDVNKYPLPELTSEFIKYLEGKKV